MFENQYFGLAALALTLFVGANASAAQSEIKKGDTLVPTFKKMEKHLTGEKIEFKSLPLLPRPVTTELIGGEKVSRRDFPTIFRQVDGGDCTATLIGEATILTAAHCVANGVMINFVISTGDENTKKSFRVRGGCVRAPGYNPPSSKSEDWALCLLEYPVLGTKYEKVDLSGIPDAGKKVTLTGYGCTEDGGIIDGKLRAGWSYTVAANDIPPSIRTYAGDSTIFTHSKLTGNDGAILCDGDSGGALFVIHGNTYNAARKIVAVNSISNPAQGFSLYAATGSNAGKSFIKSWAEEYKQKICGLPPMIGPSKCR